MRREVVRIELLCKAIAKIRAGGSADGGVGRCEMCGEVGDVHLHHIFFGSWRSDWRTFSEPDFYASLCFDCHLESMAAPHKDNDTFLALFLPRIDFSRCQAIMDFKENPGVAGKPDYKRIIADLEPQYKEAESDSWMNFDIEPDYGATDIWMRKKGVA